MLGRWKQLCSTRSSTHHKPSRLCYDEPDPSAQHADRGRSRNRLALHHAASPHLTSLRPTQNQQILTHLQSRGCMARRIFSTQCRGVFQGSLP